MPRISREFRITPIFMIIILAVIGLFLFSQFFVKKEAFEFRVPSDLDSTTLMVFKILIVGTMTYVAFILGGRIGAPLGKRDAFTLVLIGLAIWFIWDQFLAPVLQSGTITELADNLAQAILRP